MEQITGQGDRESGLVWIAAGVIFVAIIGFVDYAAPPAFSFVPLYVLAIIAAARVAGTPASLTVAAASGIAWHFGQAEPAPIPSNWMVFYWNSAGMLVTFMLVGYLYLEVRHVALQQDANTWLDPVSGAGNAKAFFRMAEAELSRSRRYGRPFSIAYLDLDSMKAVNDQFGRLGGDTLLSLVAKTIGRQIRKTDVLARVGGDEFALLMPETSGEGAAPVINRIRNRLDEILQHDGWPVILVTGVATFDTPPESVEAALKVAEDSMYAAKGVDGNAANYMVWAGEAVPAG